MLPITKGRAPAGLGLLQATPGASWSSVSGEQKEEMRTAAIAEQGGLCAYCMRRIRGERDHKGDVDCTIEHWAARSSGADPFHWPDMLGVCLGKTGHEQHCDRSRGDKPLRVHPARPDLDRLVRYLGDGQIALDSLDEKGRIKLNGNSDDVKLLNLNAISIQRSRRQVVEAVLQHASSADATRLRELIRRWEARDSDGHLPEYAGVALYFLRRRLRDRESKSKRTRGAPRP